MTELHNTLMKELADYDGKALSMLGELKADNVIETVGRRIRVKNVSALRDVANLES